MGERVPFKAGMLTAPLSAPEEVRLKGISCRDCGALALGERQHCINCTSTNVAEYIFAKHGKVYTYTVVRHAPPPPYPQENFKPFPVVWVELEDKLFVLGELKDCGLDEVEIGMTVELVVDKGWEDDNGNDVMMYKFRPTK